MESSEEKTYEVPEEDKDEETKAREAAPERQLKVFNLEDKSDDEGKGEKLDKE